MVDQSWEILISRHLSSTRCLLFAQLFHHTPTYVISNILRRKEKISQFSTYKILVETCKGSRIFQKQISDPKQAETSREKEMKKFSKKDKNQFHITFFKSDSDSLIHFYSLYILFVRIRIWWMLTFMNHSVVLMSIRECNQIYDLRIIAANL